MKIRLGAILLITGLLGCCSSTKNDAPVEPKASTAARARVSDEASVKPGINDPYFANPNVEHWIQRFEVESREIFSEREKIADFAGVQPGQTVADIGAGSGIFTRLFAGRVGPQGRVIAVDIMPSFLEHIQTQAKKDGLANVETVLCKEDSVELPPDSLDVAFLCDTYHHFEYPKSTLASIHRALRPSGTLVLIDFIRIPGQSRDWILSHVRAGEEEVTAELNAAGFQKTSESRFLSENYLLKFQKRRD